MTIIARLNTLNDAYTSIRVLRSKTIVPSLLKDGEKLVIGVDDDHAEDAKDALASDSQIQNIDILFDATSTDTYWGNFDDQNT